MSRARDPNEETHLYNQKDFSTALVAAGFKKDRSIYQYGVEFYTISLKGASVVVTLCQGHLTTSLLKHGKEGARVLEHISTSSKDEFLQKVQEWGLR